MPYFTPEYLDYMRSDAWQRKRRMKLDQVGERCQDCGKWRWQLKAPRILQVHHLTYENLGHEPLSDLQVLCKPCHEKATRRMRFWRKVKGWIF